MQLLNGLKDWNNVVLSIFSLHRYDSMTLSPCQVVDLELAESIQNESPHYPIWVRGKNFYTPFFLPLSKQSELALLAHSVLFG